jgi:hypothetical protein
VINSVSFAKIGASAENFNSLRMGGNVMNLAGREEKLAHVKGFV